MTPKEKAKELVEKYHIKVEVTFTEHSIPSIINAQILLRSAKKCALIAVDEIIEFMKMDDEYTETSYNANSKWVNYWLEVKQEIEKL
jgi:hypothetical protein